MPETEQPERGRQVLAAPARARQTANRVGRQSEMPTFASAGDDLTEASLEGLRDPECGGEDPGRHDAVAVERRSSADCTTPAGPAAPGAVEDWLPDRLVGLPDHEGGALGVETVDDGAAVAGRRRRTR